jgi:hypothetical protein
LEICVDCFFSTFSISSHCYSSKESKFSSRTFRTTLMGITTAFLDLQQSKTFFHSVYLPSSVCFLFCETVLRANYLS